MKNVYRYCPQCGHELEMDRVDDTYRRRCPQANCDYVHWDNPVPVVAGVVVLDGHLLLARNRVWPVGWFSLVTGYLERHEAPEHAARRELREELGLIADTVRFIGHYLLEDKNQLIIAYALDARGTLKLGDEIVEIRKVAIDDVPRYDFTPFTITRSIVHHWLHSLAKPCTPA